MRFSPVPALWATGVLALVCAMAPWWTVQGQSSPVALTGNESTGNLPQALALVCLGGILVTLTLRAGGRRVIGLLLAAAYGAVATLGVLRPRPGGDLVAERLGTTAFADASGVVPTPWPWAYAVTGILGLAASLWLMRRPGDPRPRGVRDRRAPLEDSLASWKAMDAGVDPTADEPTREDQR